MSNNNFDVNLALTIMEENNRSRINLLATADPSDPLVIEARAQIEAIRVKTRKVTLIMAGIVMPLVLYYTLTTTDSGMLGIIGLLFFGMLFPMLYAMGVETAAGTISEQTYAKMQWRQANDIRAMRMQSEADRAAYNAVAASSQHYIQR